jgi:hypothetical protein
MRKITIALILAMLASPVWADISITVTDLGGGKAAIGYSGTERARAFALDIMSDAGTIDAISDFEVGDDNNGYGIFPANFSRHITVDPTTGEVSDWDIEGYTPVADADDPGALGGLGTNGITIEMGSLYDTQAPPLEGQLCVITCSEACNVTVTLNATRGNVVLEDATEAVVDLAGATAIPVGAAVVGSYVGPQEAEWLSVGQPACWLNPRQCHGDADGRAQGPENYWVSTNDLDILIAAWNKTYEDISGLSINGVPLICADFDHEAQVNNKFRVSTNDLDILIANWQLAGQPAADCP